MSVHGAEFSRIPSVSLSHADINDNASILKFRGAIIDQRYHQNPKAIVPWNTIRACPTTCHKSDGIDWRTGTVKVTESAVNGITH